MPVLVTQGCGASSLLRRDHTAWTLCRVDTAPGAVTGAQPALWSIQLPLKTSGEEPVH